MPSLLKDIKSAKTVGIHGILIISAEAGLCKFLGTSSHQLH